MRWILQTLDLGMFRSMRITLLIIWRMLLSKDWFRGEVAWELGLWLGGHITLDCGNVYTAGVINVYILP
jgi:hypothetical protein